MWWSVVVVVLVICPAVRGDVADCDQNTCTNCIQTPDCIWCSKENFTKQRCVNRATADRGNFYEECEERFVHDPVRYQKVLEDKEFSKEATDDPSASIIQIKPQKVLLEMRVGDTGTIKLKYKHLRNYPIDLYYLMDGSESMRDDKDNVANLAKKLLNSMRKITKNFRLGFGQFVDKPILPYINTYPFDSNYYEGKNQVPPYSYKHILSLTHDGKEFEKVVREFKTASNFDSPESSFDGLMQVIVCEDKIHWRDHSLHLILVATDAGFHIAGDGKLAGVTTPNDKLCHLDSESGHYTHSTILDYPSIGQIREMADKHKMHILFAVTKNQEPLYRYLRNLIYRTSVSVLEADSANIIQILDTNVREIVSKVTLKSTVSDAQDVTVQIESACLDGKMEKRSTCTNLTAGDELEFLVNVRVKQCPSTGNNFNTNVTVYVDGRMQSLFINLTMLCQCNCEAPGDPGYIANAAKCNRHGDDQCGVCRCYEGHVGEFCECELSDGESVTINETRCYQTSTSPKCSGRGECICGQCVCNKNTDTSKIISGTHCQCTNYEGCQGANSLMCSDHGECKCDKCNCVEGWTGEFCDCENATHNCRQTENQEICSSHGRCRCNRCECDATYLGKFCEDCTNCPGKCVEYKSCVQCQVFQSGELSPEECLTNCTDFNSTKVISIEDVEGQLCAFAQDDNCRFFFRFALNSAGLLGVWVQEELECTNPVSLKFIGLGVILVVVVLGLVALIVWRILASIHDKREYARFVMDRHEEKWVENVSPLYRPATTVVSNPLFGTKLD